MAEPAKNPDAPKEDGAENKEQKKEAEPPKAEELVIKSF